MKRALLVATDLDACLLDEQSYSWDAARPALERLVGEGALLVLASSKTRAEMQPLAAALGSRPPLIVENGGALVVPPGRLRALPSLPCGPDGELVVALGVARRELARALGEIGAATGARLVGFSDLDATAVARLTGLSPAAAARALERDFDEPFLLEAGATAEAVVAAAERRGLRVTRGGRFFHLSGPSDKGAALLRLLELLAADGQEFETLALGDSPNDLELLRAADRAVIVPHAGGPDPALVAALPRAVVAPAPGPVGWNRAVLELLG